MVRRLNLRTAVISLAIIGLSAGVLSTVATVPAMAQVQKEAASDGGGSGGGSTGGSSRDTTKPDSKCNASLLGIPAWYNGIVGRDSHGHCGAIVSPSVFGGNGIQTFLIKVALNVVSILLFIAGYVCVGFVIFGGFKYFFSAGSPDGMSKAKSTIQNALIGIIISMASIGIVNAVAHIV